MKEKRCEKVTFINESGFYITEGVKKRQKCDEKGNGKGSRLH